MTRDPTITLDPKEWRCSSDKCAKRLTCARRMAAVPMGTPMDDGLIRSMRFNPYYAMFHASECQEFQAITRSKP